MKNLLKLMLATVSAMTISNVGATVLKDVPATPDTNAHYLFFMHGLFPEMRGPDAFHPPFNKRYETTALAKGFSEKGFIVITEIRKQGTQIEEYAQKIGSQIKQLITSGVSPAKIAVVGHSKGGAISLIVPSIVGDESVSYVVLAGCALPSTVSIGQHNPRAEYTDTIKKYAPTAKGKMLSLYDVQDDIMKTCNEYAASAPGIKMEEQELNIGVRPGFGHAVFYSPDNKWLDTVIGWLKK